MIEFETKVEHKLDNPFVSFTFGRITDIEMGKVTPKDAKLFFDKFVGMLANVAGSSPEYEKILEESLKKYELIQNNE